MKKNTEMNTEKGKKKKKKKRRKGNERNRTKKRKKYLCIFTDEKGFRFHLSEKSNRSPEFLLSPKIDPNNVYIYIYIYREGQRK